MKILLLSVLMLSMSQNLLASDQNSCVDKRVAFLAPCADGQTRYFDQGTCSESFEFENSYCANEEMTNLELVNSRVELPFEGRGRYESALIHATGQMLLVKVGVVKNCEDAYVLTGLPKSLVDNYDPSTGEIGITPMILDFKCFDDLQE